VQSLSSRKPEVEEANLLATGSPIAAMEVTTAMVVTAK
jgi:hypothetical protein